MDVTTSRVTSAPSSSATRAAVSKSTTWLTVAITPIIIRRLMTSAAVTLRRDASSPTVISSGIVACTGCFFIGCCGAGAAPRLPF